MEALSGKLTTIEESLDGVSTTILNIPESIDDKVESALASYTMTSEAWMAKFQEALNRQDENGNIIGSTIGEATISAKGIQFSKGSKKPYLTRKKSMSTKVLPASSGFRKTVSTPTDFWLQTELILKALNKFPYK